MEISGYLRQPTCLHICIDTYDAEKGPGGTISGIALEGEHPFQGMTDLFRQADRLLDKIGKPQATAQSRSFTARIAPRPVVVKATLHRTPEEVYARRGAVATGNIFIESRRNCTWQGKCLDEEGKVRIAFESEMELLSRLEETRPR